jgi:Dolichyl-phosphate-mannose-protein mannosyltransferase
VPDTDKKIANTKTAGYVLLKTWHRVALLLGLLGLAALILAWWSTANPKTSFLPRDGRAEWILFPTPPDARSHYIVNLDATFRHEFRLEQAPRIGHVSLRAAKRVELKINGSTVDLPTTSNWKDITTVDVLGFLRIGANLIEARVFNENGPPSLWLTLTTDQSTVRSDQTWSAAFTGSAWRPAALASTPRFPRTGNAIAEGEMTLNALTKIWPIWSAMGGIAILLWATGRRWLAYSARSVIGNQSTAWLRHPTTILPLVLALLWAFLFWHNAGLVPQDTGFDSRYHIEYIKYIQEHRALPLPTEGYEMFQPPLYYGVSAAILSLCGLSVTNESAFLILRMLTMLFGIAHFVLVFLAMRLLFPEQLGRQLVGLVLAALLPMQLYLSHYITNETLAATLITASLYVGLRALRYDNVASYVWLAVCLGAALLTKATALLAFLVVLGALILKRTKERSSVAVWFRTIGLTVLICFAICGWHYLRIWSHFGKPFVGNWDVSGGFSWWQDPGYHTAADYVRFGRSLVRPLFSSFAGLGDGIYSTLWGDGLCGGVSALIYRPPWNYDLMVSGYLLALAPSLIILTGAVVALCRFVRNPSEEYFLLVGLSGAISLGVIFMTLTVASYAQIKAFYGLSMLVPLCFFGVLGWTPATNGSQDRGRNIGSSKSRGTQSFRCNGAVFSCFYFRGCRSVKRRP